MMRVNLESGQDPSVSRLHHTFPAFADDQQTQHSGLGLRTFVTGGTSVSLSRRLRIIVLYSICQNNIVIPGEGKKLLGAEHPDALTSMANLASTYCNQGRWNEADQSNLTSS